MGSSRQGGCLAPGLEALDLRHQTCCLALCLVLRWRKRVESSGDGLISARGPRAIDLANHRSW
jgi:hypothetical protein